MPPYTATIRIAATPERVWPVLADVVRWPEWLPTMISVEPLGAATLAVGARYRLAQPRLRPTIWSVVELESLRSFAWESSSPGVRILATHSVGVAPGGSSDVVLQVQFAGPLSLVARALVGRLVGEYLALEVASLKQQVEAQS